MKVVIAGSRNFTNYALMCDVMSRLPSELEITEVVSGCARGADKLGERWAAEHNIPVKCFPADWETYGKKAGPIRNQQMADYADVLVAFPLKGSIGTKDMIYKAMKAHMRVFVEESD